MNAAYAFSLESLNSSFKILKIKKLQSDEARTTQITEVQTKDRTFPWTKVAKAPAATFETAVT